MTDFMLRTISKENGDMSVTRSRNTSGYAGITIRVGTLTTQKIEFNSHSFADYESKARLLAEMLQEIVSDGCELPQLTTTHEEEYLIGDDLETELTRFNRANLKSGDRVVVIRKKEESDSNGRDQK